MQCCLTLPAYLVFDSVEEAALSRASLAQQTYSNRIVSTSDSGDPSREAWTWHCRHVTCSAALDSTFSLLYALQCPWDQPLYPKRRGSTWPRPQGYFFWTCLLPKAWEDRTVIVMEEISLLLLIIATATGSICQDGNNTLCLPEGINSAPTSLVDCIEGVWKVSTLHYSCTHTHTHTVFHQESVFVRTASCLTRQQNDVVHARSFLIGKASTPVE